MGFDQMEVPEDRYFIEAFGATPVPDGANEFARRVALPVGDDDVLTFSYDVVARSVRYKWVRGGKTNLEVFREGATVVAIRESVGSTSLVVTFDVGVLAGELRIEIFPEISIQDELLFS